MEKKQVLERVLLNMNYDSKKTLQENYKSIIKESVKIVDISGELNPKIYDEGKEDEQEFSNIYKDVLLQQKPSSSYNTTTPGYLVRGFSVTPDKPIGVKDNEFVWFFVLDVDQGSFKLISSNVYSSDNLQRKQVGFYHSCKSDDIVFYRTDKTTGGSLSDYDEKSQEQPFNSRRDAGEQSLDIKMQDWCKPGQKKFYGKKDELQKHHDKIYSEYYPCLLKTKHLTRSVDDEGFVTFGSKEHIIGDYYKYVFKLDENNDLNICILEGD